MSNLKIKWTRHNPASEPTSAYCCCWLSFLPQGDMVNFFSKLLSRRGLFVVTALATSVVVAANWGPFIISHTTFDSDSEIDFVAAGNVPRQVMLTEVQKIKRGDIVRVIYADGKVYDFEASRQCSYAASVSCGLVYPKQKVNATVSPSPGVLLKRDAYLREMNKCRGGSIHYVSYSINTGYWESNFVVYGENKFGTTARWVDTGVVKITEKISPEDRDNCK